MGIMEEKGLPILPTQSHIIPVHVGDSDLCTKASQMLLEEESIYVQPINFPTVDRGTERLRFTATPFHTDEMADKLVKALEGVFRRLNIPMEIGSDADEEGSG